MVDPLTHPFAFAHPRSGPVGQLPGPSPEILRCPGLDSPQSFHAHRGGVREFGHRQVRHSRDRHDRRLRRHVRRPLRAAHLDPHPTCQGGRRGDVRRGGGGLFGAAPAAAAPAAPAAAATTTGGGGLFGAAPAATPTAATPAAPSFSFGAAKPATTTPAAGGSGLFGAAKPATTTTSQAYSPLHTLGQDILNHLTVHIGESTFDPIVIVSQLFVINT